MTNDITVRFASHSNILYAGILQGGTVDLNILRKANFVAPGLMTVVVNKTNDDQPYIQAHSHAGTDRVYVSENDFNGNPTDRESRSEPKRLDGRRIPVRPRRAACHAGTGRPTDPAGDPSGWHRLLRVFRLARRRHVHIRYRSCS